VAPALNAPPLHLPTLLETGRPVVLFSLDQVRSGVAALAERFEQAAGAGVQLLVADALSDDDLTVIDQATALALPAALRCGSAGLLGAVAARLVASGATSIVPAAMAGPPGPALLVVGSGSPVARRQIAALAGRCHIRCLGDASTASTGDMLLHLPPPHPGAALDGSAARAWAAALAHAALPEVVALDPGLLVLVGGDTAAAVLGLLGVERLPIERELLPGMPMSRLWVAGRERAVVLKAGNHGDDGTLVEVLRRARGLTLNP
jgi:uncharacterized protein YgbK (DUF1537 family)